MEMAISLIFLYKVVRKRRQDADQMMRLRLTIVPVASQMQHGMVVVPISQHV
jgi:hypothetical protein